MIKVGYLVSYDYDYLPISLLQVYPFVDKIIIAYDVNFVTWSGNSFVIPQSFFNEINKIDIQNKISYYQDNFYMPELSPMECELRERNMLLKQMGNGWKIQLDVDEYIYDFKEVKKYLKKLWYLNVFPSLTPIALSGTLITLYKQIDDGFLYIDNDERFPFITNYPIYISARRNFEIKNFHIDAKVIHQSWAREYSEMETKFKNWGHRDDFDKDKIINIWSQLNSVNYKKYTNFHPIVPHVWNELHFIASNSVSEFIEKFSKKHPQKLIAITNHMKKKLLRQMIKKVLIKIHFKGIK